MVMTLNPVDLAMDDPHLDIGAYLAPDQSEWLGWLRQGSAHSTLTYRP